MKYFFERREFIGYHTKCKQFVNKKIHMEAKKEIKCLNMTFGYKNLGKMSLKIHLDAKKEVKFNVRKNECSFSMIEKYIWN